VREQKIKKALNHKVPSGFTFLSFMREVDHLRSEEGLPFAQVARRFNRTVGSIRRIYEISKKDDLQLAREGVKKFRFQKLGLRTRAAIDEYITE
jgi:hypothetical protein